MLKKDVVAHFGTMANIARALHISRTAVSNWGIVIPLKWAEKIQEITGGKMKVSKRLYHKVRMQRKKNYGTGKRAANFLIDS